MDRRKHKSLHLGSTRERRLNTQQLKLMLSDSLMVEGVSDYLEMTNHRCDHNINPSVENGGGTSKDTFVQAVRGICICAVVLTHCLGKDSMGAVFMGIFHLY